jgi:hypothetical protein
MLRRLSVLISLTLEKEVFGSLEDERPRAADPSFATARSVLSTPPSIARSADSEQGPPSIARSSADSEQGNQVGQFQGLSQNAKVVGIRMMNSRHSGPKILPKSVSANPKEG